MLCTPWRLLGAAVFIKTALYISLSLVAGCTSVFAQNANDILNIFGGIMQSAIMQANQAEWKKVPQSETSCVDQALRQRGSDLQTTIRQGITPSDARVADIRATCRSTTVQNNSSDNSFYYVANTRPPDAYLSLRTNPTTAFGQRIRTMPNIPDYGILSQVDYQYPVSDAYFAYTSRGCIRKCHFCGVPKLEGAQRDTESLTDLVREIDRLYGPKKDLLLMDNNVVASPKFKEIVAEIRDLGFTPGAKLRREGMRTPVLRRVDFNQGVDARILCKDPMYMRELASICLKPLRVAFDHLGVKKPYEQAIRYAHEFGLTELSNYMLYNFHDGPADLFERMRLNVTLNEELGVRIWSFPMRYQPTDRPDRGHIGPKWSRYQLRSLQIVLQATHGVVSGAPEFFKRAFGDTQDDFEEILAMPHDFIFNRDWYERFEGRAELDEFRSTYSCLTPEQRAELLALLSSCDPREFALLAQHSVDRNIKAALQFYIPVPKDELAKIWAKQKRLTAGDKKLEMGLTEEEFVEDAGLESDLPLRAISAPKASSRQQRVVTQ